MTTRHFDRDLDDLGRLIEEMGALVEEQVGDAIRALLELDSDLAGRVIERDIEVDRKELEIDSFSVELIARMQPIAVDLRFVAMMMKITPELERIADLAQDVCERVLELNQEEKGRLVFDLTPLARGAQAMVRDALIAMRERDADLARAVIDRDDEVDRLMEQTFRGYLTYMLEDTRTIARAIRLTFISKYFERMADGATNICESVVYLVEAKVVKHPRVQLPDAGE